MKGITIKLLMILPLLCGFGVWLGVSMSNHKEKQAPAAPPQLERAKVPLGTSSVVSAEPPIGTRLPGGGTYGPSKLSEDAPEGAPVLLSDFPMDQKEIIPFHFDKYGEENSETYSKINQKFLAALGLSAAQQNAIMNFYEQAYAEVRASEKRLVKLVSQDEKTGATELLFPSLGPDLWNRFEAIIRANAPIYTAEYLILYFFNSSRQLAVRKLGAYEVRITCAPIINSHWSKITMTAVDPETGQFHGRAEVAFDEKSKLEHYLIKDILTLHLPDEGASDAGEAEDPPK